jgi:hypothetical protein
MAQIWCRRCATMDHQHQPKASKTLQQHNRPLVFDQEDPVLKIPNEEDGIESEIINLTNVRSPTQKFVKNPVEES